MRNVAIEAQEVSLNGHLNVGRKIIGTFGGKKKLVLFFDERSKCGGSHLEPSFTLMLVVGDSEHACLAVIIMSEVFRDN